MPLALQEFEGAKFVSLFFMFATASEIDFEKPSVMHTVTAQSCRSGKMLKRM
jgi:hypothetical protein